MCPSNSAFIKNRLGIILSSENYPLLIEEVKKKKIAIEGFKVEYLVIKGDSTKYQQRLEKLKDIGYSIEDDPDYYHPRSSNAGVLGVKLSPRLRCFLTIYTSRRN